MSYKYKLVPEGIYNQLIHADTGGDVLKSNLPPEAKVLLYQEKVRNMAQQRLNRENKPVLVQDPSLQAKIEQVLRLLKTDVRKEVNAREEMDVREEMDEREEEDVPEERDARENADAREYNVNNENATVNDNVVNEEQQEIHTEVKMPLKRKQPPIRRPNKKFLKERRTPINFEEEIRDELNERIRSIRKRDPSIYRFKPDYKPFKPKYNRVAPKRKIKRNIWEEYVESGRGPKATIRPPPPFNIAKLVKRRLNMDKKVVNQRLFEHDAPIPKRSQRFLNNRVKGWTSYTF